MNIAKTMPAAARPRRLQDRVALVTGSTSGIGLGIARALAEEGAAIVLNGLGDGAEIERTRSALAEAHGVEVMHHGADLSHPSEIERMIYDARTAFGSLDILVNNAGIQHVAGIVEFPAEKWDRIIAINLSAAFHAMKAALSGMKAKGWGRVVNIASAHGHVASPFKSAYVAAKHGLIGLTKVAALEHARDGITANAVCPGYVWTPLVEKQIEDQARTHGIPREEVVRDIMLARQPNKRFASVDEIGATVAFLCSDAAASITGASINVDGGWTAE